MRTQIVVLVLSPDVQIARNLQDRTKSFAAEFRFLPCPTTEKLFEYPKNHVIDAVVVDDAFMDPTDGPLMDRVKTAMGSRAPEIPLLLLSAERTPESILQIMNVGGFRDIFTKPIDPSIFFQKLQIHLQDHRFLKDNLLFSMKVDAEMALGLQCRLISASEYGVSVVVNRPFAIGEVFMVYGKLFGDHDGEVVGRVTSCVQRVDEKDRYDVGIIFVAPRKEILSTIRLWMKSEYIRTRERSL